MIKAKDYVQTTIEYADEVVKGNIIVGEDIVNACKRFQEDMKREDLELRPKEPNAICSIMEGFFVHSKGEDMEGRPLLGKPLILQPWEVFCVVNCHGFYYTGTDERRFKEAMIEVARKNGKTSFIAAWAFAAGVVQRQSGSTIYIVANALKQALGGGSRRRPQDAALRIYLHRVELIGVAARLTALRQQHAGIGHRRACAVGDATADDAVGRRCSSRR